MKRNGCYLFFSITTPEYWEIVNEDEEAKKMNVKKLLYSAMILGTVSTSVVSGGVALADTQNATTPTVSQKDAQQTLGSTTKDPQQIQSSATVTKPTAASTDKKEVSPDKAPAASQEQQAQATTQTSAPAPAAANQHVQATQQATTKAATPTANATVTDGWTKTETATTITLTDYQDPTGTTKDVVVPTNTDFNEPNKEVHITKDVMNKAATAANANSGTLVVSSGQNGKKVVADGADWFNSFSGLNHLTKIDLGNFDTSHVTNMNQMFYGCSGLTNLDVSKFNTSNVIDMKQMFLDCHGLSSLDVSKFNTSKVENMSAMFADCAATSLDVSHFDTSKVTDMSSMFSSCATTSLDVSKFNTSNVTDMASMFLDCAATSLDLSNFDTSNVTDMRQMFWDCAATSLDLSNFDTSKVTNMSNMFLDCAATSLDLSNFDTSNVTYMINMFKATTARALTIYATDSKLKAYNYAGDNITPTIKTSLKDITLAKASVDFYEGDLSWDAAKNVTKVSDKDGKDITNVAKVSITAKDSANQVIKLDDLKKKAGVYKVDYHIPGFTKIATVTVKQDQTALNVHDSTLTQGDTWDPASNITQALDRDGKDAKVTVKHAGTVDTTKVGTYKVTYSLVKADGTTITDPATITVKDDTALTVHDSTLTQGDKWNPASNITKALDKYGKDAKAAVTHTGNVDTTKVGTYKVTYSLAKADGTKINAPATITVQAKVTKYQVKFVAGQGGTLSGKTNQQIVKGAKVTSVPTAKANSGYKFDGWYNGTKKVDPKTVVINGNTTFTGKFTKAAVPVQTDTMYRLYNPNSGEHFYTADKNELAKVRKAGWRFEGTAWKAPKKGTPGAKPVYRLYNPNAGDHHYTMDKNEYKHLIKVGWRDEGIGWYSAGKIPVYRQYNPNAKAGAHNFTTNINEVKNLVKHGWRDEGKAWFGE